MPDFSCCHSAPPVTMEIDYKRLSNLTKITCFSMIELGIKPTGLGPTMPGIYLDLATSNFMSYVKLRLGLDQDSDACKCSVNVK